MNERYLTKSRYKLALECPTKLYYTGKKSLYYDTKVDNEFLKALAEGGFQVGELAKLYYPGGYQIEELDFAKALAKTKTLLELQNVIIYEAAFQYGSLFVRADILVKTDRVIRLIEVKAKSYDPARDNFLTKKDEIVSKWEPYLYDVAFQEYVVRKAIPDYSIVSFLLLADKSKKASVDGLNQLFFICNENGHCKVKFLGDPLTAELGDKILVELDVTEIVKKINATEGFENNIHLFAEKYWNDEKIQPRIGVQCGNCEFKPDKEKLSQGFRSGFNECWLLAGLDAEDLNKELILSLWDFKKKDAYIKSGRFFLADLDRADLQPATKPKPNSKPGLSRIDRQVLQIDKAKAREKSYYFDKQGLQLEMLKWKFPLHFIDFETTAVAIPFNAGRRPYEQIAFQYSHHTVDQDSVVEHKGEWISMTDGAFPNFDFIRMLKKELGTDEGTIFRYAAHENTILNVIHRQLKESSEADADELCAFIQSITTASGSSAGQWDGDRKMVDLLEMVLQYYYDPASGGSNSIKMVLPAILQSSAYLREKYGAPIYGKEIISRNFQNWSWINFNNNGQLINPYSLLPPIHVEATNEELDAILADEEAGIADGGAAMIAFARMQFTEMSNKEKEKTRAALLRYCELDTLAMVMIYEAWREWCK